jgi:hypothetical protein
MQKTPWALAQGVFFLVRSSQNLLAFYLWLENWRRIVAIRCKSSLCYLWEDIINCGVA